MAMFIRVDVDGSVIEGSPGLADKLVEVCPVKIFTLGSAPNSVEVVEANVDECTLCDLCMEASPKGIRVVKLYNRGRSPPPKSPKSRGSSGIDRETNGPAIQFSSSLFSLQIRASRRRGLAQADFRGIRRVAIRPTGRAIE